MSTQIPQDTLQSLVPYLTRVKQHLFGPHGPPPLDAEEAKDVDARRKKALEEAEEKRKTNCNDDDAVSTADSVFDGSVGSTETGVTESTVAPAVWYTRKDLVDLMRYISQRITLPHLQKLQVDIGWTTFVIPSLAILTLHPCPNSGNLHSFKEEQRCIRCDKQLCESCYHSILDGSTRYASQDSASLVGNYRYNCLAAQRIYSTCSAPTCASTTQPAGRCFCMEKLLSATTPQDTGIDGFYHCLECAISVLDDLKLRNGTIHRFGTVGGDEFLAEYICSCGAPADASLPRVCKLCMKACAPYTLNAFDTIQRPGRISRVVMRSVNVVNGGGEGQDGWNSGEVLWWLNAQ